MGILDEELKKSSLGVAGRGYILDENFVPRLLPIYLFICLFIYLFTYFESDG